MKGYKMNNNKDDLYIWLLIRTISCVSIIVMGLAVIIFEQHPLGIVMSATGALALIAPYVTGNKWYKS
jgi:hydrogenase/urease accessory protein HupE